MALTERYVTQAAAGGGDGTEGTPWTFAEAITHSLSNTGQRYNILSDGAYSIGATTFGAGTFQLPNIWRGYNVTIGDCDNLGRNADGTLNTTGMPAITITGLWTMAEYVTLQNMNITGALSSALIGNTSVDLWNMLSCRVENTQNNAAAMCLQGDDHHAFIHSDFICSGSAHGRAINADGRATVIGCRFEITTNETCLEVNPGCIVINCVFIQNGSVAGSGLVVDSAIALSTSPIVFGNTFYNFTNAVGSTSGHVGGVLLLVRNHATDCGQFVNNTTNITAFDIQNRTRDNTSPPSTVELVSAGAITTDAGDETTDFVDAAIGDMHLLVTAAGYNAGWDGSDIGGLQTAPSGGSIIVRRG